MLLFPVYVAVTTLGSPLAPLALRLRETRGKEDRARLGERLGHPGLSRPEGPLVWLHGASVGEALALLPLIDRLAETRPGLHLLLTTGTVTSAAVIAPRLPATARHQFLPLDTPGAVDRFLDHWRPDLVLWSESDLWPNMLAGLDRRGIPRALLNGRMSERSFDRWRRAPKTAHRLVGGFSPCLGQTPEDAQRLARLGGLQARCLGNLKQAAAPPQADPDALKAALGALSDRPRWLMASTHAGEEALAGRLHATLRQRHPGLVTVIVPRHGARAPAVARELEDQGLSVRRRSQGWPEAETDILLGDTMGEMGLYLRLAPVVVMGKTFVRPGGGQNPLEAARLDSAVLWGPEMGNFAEIAAEMEAAGAAEALADQTALAARLDALLGDPQDRAARAAAARAYAGARAAILDDVLTALAPVLDPLTPAATTTAPRTPRHARA